MNPRPQAPDHPVGGEAPIWSDFEQKEEEKTTAGNGTCEVVRVLSDAFLISSTWHRCDYSTRDRQPLRPGFYFVLWPARVSSPGYDRHARYFGPLPTQLLAEQLETSAVSLGLIGPASSRPCTEAEAGAMHEHSFHGTKQAGMGPTAGIETGPYP